MTRAQKEAAVAELSDKVRRAKSVVFTTISGYTMADADALREKGREAGVELGVAKKTLLLRALKDSGVEVDKTLLEGSVLTSFGFTDEVSAAKMMAGFAKDREGIRLVGGVLEGAAMDAAAVTALATLPSKEELLAKLVGSINAPVSGFVNALAGNLRNIVYVMNAIKEAKA